MATNSLKDLTNINTNVSHQTDPETNTVSSKEGFGVNNALLDEPWSRSLASHQLTTSKWSPANVEQEMPVLSRYQMKKIRQEALERGIREREAQRENYTVSDKGNVFVPPPALAKQELDVDSRYDKPGIWQQPPSNTPKVGRESDLALISPRVIDLKSFSETNSRASTPTPVKNASFVSSVPTSITLHQNDTMQLLGPLTQKKLQHPIEGANLVNSQPTSTASYHIETLRGQAEEHEKKPEAIDNVKAANQVIPGPTLITQSRDDTLLRQEQSPRTKPEAGVKIATQLRSDATLFALHHDDTLLGREKLPEEKPATIVEVARPSMVTALASPMIGENPASKTLIKPQVWSPVTMADQLKIEVATKKKQGPKSTVKLVQPSRTIKDAFSDPASAVKEYLKSSQVSSPIAISRDIPTPSLESLPSTVAETKELTSAISATNVSNRNSVIPSTSSVKSNSTDPRSWQADLTRMFNSRISASATSVPAPASADGALVDPKSSQAVLAKPKTLQTATASPGGAMLIGRRNIAPSPQKSPAGRLTSSVALPSSAAHHDDSYPNVQKKGRGFAAAETSVDVPIRPLASVAAKATSVETFVVQPRNGTTTHTTPSGKQCSTAQAQLYFGSWAKPQERDSARARVRRVKLTNLPTDCTMRSVIGLVFGGALEQVLYKPGTSYATIVFFDADACNKFYDQTSNGIEWQGDKRRVIWVEKGKEGDPVSGILQNIINRRLTRCVRAIDADDGWTHEALHKIGLGSKSSFKLESVETGTKPPRTEGGEPVQVVEWRFTNIADAIMFKSEMMHAVDWEHCNTKFGQDPCAIATEPRFFT